MPSPVTHGEWYIFLIKKVVNGPFGPVVEWEDSTRFQATPSLDRSAQGALAAQQGAYNTLSFAVDKTLPVAFNDYFKQEFDPAKVYQVKSDPDAAQTPKESGMNFKVFDAVQTSLPTM